MTIELSETSRLAAMWFFATPSRDVLAVVYKEKADYAWVGKVRIRSYGDVADPFDPNNNDRKSWLNVTPNPMHTVAQMVQSMRTAVKGMRDSIPAALFGRVEVYEEILFDPEAPGIAALDKLKGRSWFMQQPMPPLN